MKKIVFLLVLVIVLVSCSNTPKMVYSGGNYNQMIKEKKNILLTLQDFPGYQARVYSQDIGLGFLSWRLLRVSILNGEVVLLENLQQGTKVIYVQLVPKVDMVSRKTSESTLKEKNKKRQGKIILNIGTEQNSIQITNPKIIKVQQVVDVGKATSLKKVEEEMDKFLMDEFEYEEFIKNEYKK